MDGIEEQLAHSKSGKEVFEDMKFSQCTKRFPDEPPKTCPDCNYDGLQGIELLGAKEGTLFWECVRCEGRFLRYTKQTTIKYLNIASKLWIDLGGLENICEELPN
tara:strand:+ start:72 stop:386 length:315 start_codon:yes stop_codon:yes gene_type:complete